jgi:predicted TIM-barrel fold metal-dependent hydrolase
VTAGPACDSAIDTHHHFIPKAILTDFARYVQPNVAVRLDGERMHVSDGRVETYVGTTTISDIERNVAALNATGTRAILSAGIIPMWLNLDGARIYNREVAAIQRRYPGLFFGLAHAPPFGADGNFDELRRAIVEDGLKGVAMTSTFAGLYPDDSAYRPFYETINELGVPIFIHGAACPVDVPNLEPYNLGHSLGRGVDLALVTARLLFGGVLSDFPNLRFLIGHLGGVFYAMVERLLDDAASRPENRIPARDYRALLRRMWFDTAPAIWNGSAEIDHAVKTLGTDRLCFGSDFPFAPNGAAIVRALAALHGVGLPASEERAILFSNAAELFGLKG